MLSSNITCYMHSTEYVNTYSSIRAYITYTACGYIKMQHFQGTHGEVIRYFGGSYSNVHMYTRSILHIGTPWLKEGIVHLCCLATVC